VEPRRHRLPEGGTWSDRVSAVFNDQSKNTWSYFHNYDGKGGWVRVLSANARDHRLNPARDGVNDIVDGVHVCGSVPNPWRPNR
jgi:hypothetical protein